MTLSENLTKLAHKIDWTKGENEDEELDECVTSVQVKDSEEESSKKPDIQLSTWPWDSVRNKLRSALTEVCVLADVVTVAKEKRYMVLDPVQQDQPDQRQLAQLFSKKRVLKIIICVKRIAPIIARFEHFNRDSQQLQTYFCMVLNA